MSHFLKELNYLGVTARIKRLNDALTYSIKDLYLSQHIDIEPSWHLTFLLLKKHQQLSLVELSKRLHISQPAITKIIKKMITKNYIQLTISESDSRIKLVELTTKSKKLFPKWEKTWELGQKAIAEMLEGNEAFLNALTAFEIEQSRESFKERTQRLLKGS